MYSHRKINKGPGELGNERPIGDNPNYCIICHLEGFAVPADHRVNIQKREKPCRRTNKKNDGIINNNNNNNDNNNYIPETTRYYSNQQKERELAELWTLLKESEKDTDLDQASELKNQWNMKETIIPIVISTLGSVTKELVKGLEDLEIRGWIDTIQITAMLRSWRLEETCQSNSIERPLPNADVKNSRSQNNRYFSCPVGWDVEYTDCFSAEG